MKECSHPMPDRVTVDDLGVTQHFGDGTVERVTWGDLMEVWIETNDRGPFLEDVYFVLVGRGGSRYLIPQGAEGTQHLVKRLQWLPAFDNEELIKAMSCADCARFLCWRRDRNEKASSC